MREGGREGWSKVEKEKTTGERTDSQSSIETDRGRAGAGEATLYLATMTTEGKRITSPFTLTPPVSCL